MIPSRDFFDFKRCIEASGLFGECQMVLCREARDFQEIFTRAVDHASSNRAPTQQLGCSLLLFWLVGLLLNHEK